MNLMESLMLSIGPGFPGVGCVLILGCWSLGCGDVFGYLPLALGGFPERSKGSDCKSDGNAFAGSNPAPPTFWV